MNATNRFREVFKNKRVVLPVIHVRSQEQALRNAEKAHEAGADGIFLINHAIKTEALLSIHAVVADAFPHWWIGVNCLGLDPARVFDRISNRVAGVWVDNAMIREDRQHQQEAETVLAAQRKNGWTGLYFGGVAFKYQRHVDDLRAVVHIAQAYMDVVTTSGPGTGQAADEEKIQIMKEALGDFPLAIASGITPNNVFDYLDVSDCYLVATGISRSFEEFSSKLVKKLVKRVHAYDQVPGI